MLFYQTPATWANVGLSRLGPFGAKDTGVPSEAVHQLEQDLKRAGVEAQVHIYPDAGHAFMNERRPDAYNAQAAEDAWRRIIEFFRQHPK